MGELRDQFWHFCHGRFPPEILTHYFNVFIFLFLFFSDPSFILGLAPLLKVPSNRVAFCSYVAHTTKTAGWAANDAERRKVQKYAELQGRFFFNPVGFETFGSWGNGAKDLVKEIASRIVEQTGESRAKQFLRQRISIEIQRGNAASVLGTVDKPKSIDELFFMLGTGNP